MKTSENETSGGLELKDRETLPIIHRAIVGEAIAVSATTLGFMLWVIYIITESFEFYKVMGTIVLWVILEAFYLHKVVFEDSEINTYRVYRHVIFGTMRAIEGGKIFMKSIFEVPVPGFEEIKAEKERILVENAAGEQYEIGSTGVFINIEWNFFLRIYPVEIANYMAYTKEDAVRIFRTRVVEFHQAWCAGYTGDINGLISSAEQLGNGPLHQAFENAFGGPKKTDRDERLVGRLSDTPRISRIARVTSGQKAKEEGSAMKQTSIAYAESIQDCMTRFGCDREQAKEMVDSAILINNGNATIMYLKGEGVDNLEHIGAATIAERTGDMQPKQGKSKK